jgi:membrane fusion protein, multidrug efflux system
MDGFNKKNHLNPFLYFPVMKTPKQIKMKHYFLASMFFLSIACSSDGNNNAESVEAATKIPDYTLAAVENSGVATMIKLPAQLTAFQEVSIFPKVNGYVKNVFVDIGSVVRTGETLMILEAPEIVEATIHAREKYAEAIAGFSIDKENYNRLLEASATAGAVSAMDLSAARSKTQADSALANAEKSNWQMQQSLQDYLRVTAPFNGVITERNVFPGALVNAEAKDKPMLELKDISKLRLKVDVPESIAGSFKIKDTISFFTSSFPGKPITAQIARISMNINAQIRSERMEADVENKNNLLQPGMYADVVLYSRGTLNALSVPRSALVISTEGKYVIAVRSGEKIKVNVLTGNETKERIEIFGQIQPTDKVIAPANDEIKVDH